MKRDFSKSARDRILGIADEVEKEKISGFTDWCGDRYLDFKYWIGELNIKNYLNNVTAYQKQVIDKNNSSEKSLKEIFAAVDSQDKDFQKTFSAAKTLMKKLDKYIQQMGVLMSPAPDGIKNSTIKSLQSLSNEFDNDLLALQNETERVSSKYGVEEKEGFWLDDVLWRLEKLVDGAKTAGEFFDRKGLENGADYASGLLSYIMSGKQFFDSKPEELLYNLGDFTQETGKFYTGTVYELIKKYLKITKGEATSEVFGYIHSNFITSVDLAGGFINIILKIHDVFDPEKSKNIYEQFSGVMKVGSSGIDIVKTVFLWSDAGRHAKEIAKTVAKASNQGPLQKILVGASTVEEAVFRIGKTVLSFSGQAFESYGKYIEDGVFDMNDLGMTGVDASTKGLCTLIGLDLVEDVYKLISGDKDADFAEALSGALKNKASAYGKRAGEIVLNNEFLNDLYQKGGLGEAAALTMAIIDAPIEKIKDGLTQDAMNYGEAAGYIIYNNNTLNRLYNSGGVGEVVATTAGIIDVPVEIIKNQLVDTYHWLFGGY